MDSLNEVRQAIERLLTEVADRDNVGFVNAEVRTYCLFDRERDQYLVLRLGWQGGRRVKGIVLHVRLEDEVVWIEENWTERPIASELATLGVPPDSIVLGFKPPSLQAHSETAVA